MGAASCGHTERNWLIRGVHRAALVSRALPAIRFISAFFSVVLIISTWYAVKVRTHLAFMSLVLKLFESI